MMWGIFRAQCAFFGLPPSGVESPVLLPINPQGLWTYAFRLKDRVKNNNNNKKCAQSVLQLSSLIFALGILTICYEPLVSGSSCSLFGVGAMRGSTRDTCSASPGWLLDVFYDFLRDWWTRLQWSILLLTGDAPVARLLSLTIWVLLLLRAPVFSG